MDGVCVSPATLKDSVMASLSPKSIASPLLQRHNLQRARRGTPVSSPSPSRLKQTPAKPQSLVQTAICRGHFSPLQLRKVKESLEEITTSEKQATLPVQPSIELIEDFQTLEPSYFAELIAKAREGLKVHAPELCVEGVNGTYFLKDKEGRKIAVFKPQDEEGASEHNPKLKSRSASPKKGSWVGTGGVTSSKVRKDFKVGEASYREVAAYLLDRKHHFYGVPNTCMVRIAYPTWKSEKIGSLQEFVMNDGASWDIGPSLFPVKEVHKIGILDIHIFNTDRHGGNILMSENDDGMYKLTPIDHGYSLPTSLDRAWFDWLTWPQSRVPFDEETKRYIASIDPDEDARMLRQYLPIPDESIVIMRISTLLLKKGVQHNLTLSQIGMIASRKQPEKPSVLEIMVEEARSIAKLICEQQMQTDNKVIEETFITTLANTMDEHMSKMSRETGDTRSKMTLW
jgi:hypothetical protein